MNLCDIHLVLFLSRATPLSKWERTGILERELAIYQRLSARLRSVSIVTSGGAEELHYQELLGEIRLLYNRWGLSPNAYSLLAPILHGPALRQASVYKSNQLDGAWTAVIAGAIHRRPVIVRAGYLWAELIRQEGKSRLRAALTSRLQAFSLRSAQTIFLTTEAMRQSVAGNYAIAASKIKVIPNYVDCQVFRPLPEVTSQEERICYVGRLEPVKNLDVLIEALAGLPGISLVLIGEGQQRPELERLAQARQVDVQFQGALPQAQIPLEINRSQVFVLPSKSEGHPKALIEAMACGAAVIGTEATGIRELIRHGETGWLCQPEPGSLRQATQQVLADPGLRRRLGDNARQYILEHFALEKVVEMELQAILEACAR
ncbi:MAG: glycosyltransferase family 4 protein [Chloroflexota bacterium]